MENNRHEDRRMRSFGAHAGAYDSGPYKGPEGWEKLRYILGAQLEVMGTPGALMNFRISLTGKNTLRN